MNKTLWVIVILLNSVFIIGDITMMGLFALTTVGLTSDEQIMLTMTSNEINTMHATSIVVLNQLIATGAENATQHLLALTNQYKSLVETKTSQDGSIVVLDTLSTTREAELLAYNATIDQQMGIIQTKLNNITLPSSLNLTANDDTATISNGTVLLSNPNDRSQNVTLNYKIKTQLGSTYIEVGPIGASISYTTLGVNNWVGLKDWVPPIFVNNTIETGSFTIDQVLDNQRNKVGVSPPIGTRVYDTDNNEIRLEFASLLVGGQTITIDNLLGFNVGFI